LTSASRTRRPRRIYRSAVAHQLPGTSQQSLGDRADQRLPSCRAPAQSP